MNASLEAGTIDIAEAAKQLEAIRDGLYKERDREESGRRVFNSENRALLEKYWRAEYAGRDLVDPDTMRGDLRRAVDAVGSIPLLSGDRGELQAALGDVAAGDAGKQRRLASRLNQLLAWAGRDFRLRLSKPTRPDVLFLTLEEFELVLPHFGRARARKDGSYRAGARERETGLHLLARVALHSGCRLGEIFGLTSASLREGYLRVVTQLDPGMRRRETKTRQERRASVIPPGMEYVRAWLDLPAEVRAELRGVKHATEWRRACVRAFGKKRADKLVTFHDLRHSYAVHLIGRGVPINLVAQSLGNSVAVCEKYYAGFVLSDASVDAIQGILKKQN